MTSEGFYLAVGLAAFEGDLADGCRRGISTSVSPHQWFFTVTEYPVVARTRAGSRTLTDVDILAVRFPGAGRCSQRPTMTARAVLESGKADTVVGKGMPCQIRRFAFGGSVGDVRRYYRVISLGHVARFLAQYLHRHPNVLLKTQLKDEALELMAVLLKAGLPLGSERNG